MDEIELLCFQIISNVGAAKSLYIEAMHKSRENEFDEAYKLIEEGQIIYSEGHKAHFELVQKEAAKEDIKLSLLLMHAEDQMMSADTIKVVAEEFIELRKQLNK